MIESDFPRTEFSLLTLPVWKNTGLEKYKMACSRLDRKRLVFVAKFVPNHARKGYNCCRGITVVCDSENS